MRRSLRKPRDMSIREYVNRVLELNDQLASYPGTGDITDGTKLPEDEILDLLEFGIPNTWQKAMLLQDFDAQVHTCLLYTSPSPRDLRRSRMPSSA